MTDIRYRNWLVLYLLLSVCFFPHAGYANGSSASSYTNARYGFSLSWPAGVYTVREADNGDGITLTDRDGLEMRAWGSMAPGVLGQGLTELVREERGRFSRVTYERIRSDQNFAVISGFRGDRIGWIKIFYAGDTCYVADISYPAAAKDRYDAFVGAVSRSFCPPSGSSR